MAELGFRTIDEMIGRADRLDVKPALDHWKAHGLDLSPILYHPDRPAIVRGATRRAQDHGLERGARQTADRALRGRAGAAAAASSSRLPIRNVNRTVGTLLGYEVTPRYGGAGLPDDTIRLKFTGSAGQSFGAFVPRGITLTLEGDANDYVGKGLSGGRLIVYPPRRVDVRGRGEHHHRQRGALRRDQRRGLRPRRRRRALRVRNSGATAVVEGVGDHGCEYMTGGRVVVLGRTGRNFAAGMSGGVAYVLDLAGGFARRCNRDMVDLEPLGEDDEAWLRRLVSPAHRADRQQPCVAPAPPLGRRARAVRQGDAARLQARAQGRGRRQARRAAPCSSPTWSVPPMGKPTGFIEITRKKQPSRPVAERLQDWHEVYLPYPDEALRQQGARCMDCGIPFCHQGCPLGNLIPDWNDLVYRDRWQAAIERLLATNNFPEFTGRLCPAPCEGSCVLGINDDPVTIKSIENPIIERALEEGWVKPHPPATRTGKRVAVVGSGPAGLAAADQLNKAGHTVTVFERADRIGGLLRYGIPEFKMEKRVLDRRLALMEAEGVALPHAGARRRRDSGRRAAPRVRRDRPRGRPTIPRDLPIPGRDSRASTSRWTT